MSNTLRNSLILLGILIVIIVFRITFENKLSGLLDQFNSEIEKLLSKADTAEMKRKQIENAQEELSRLREKQLKQKKVLRKIDTPAISLEYLLQLREFINPKMVFDFVLQKKTNQDSTNYHQYALSGNSKLSELESLIFHLENQKPIYTMENLKISPYKNEPTDSVHYSFQINAYYDVSGSANDLIEIQDLAYPKKHYQLFRKKIYVPTLEKNENLIDCENIEILAMTEKKIFLRDSNGKLDYLQVGDRVLNGKLKSINLEKKTATFIINKTGIWKSIQVAFTGGN